MTIAKQFNNRELKYIAEGWALIHDKTGQKYDKEKLRCEPAGKNSTKGYELVELIRGSVTLHRVLAGFTYSAAMTYIGAYIIDYLNTFGTIGMGMEMMEEYFVRLRYE